MVPTPVIRLTVVMDVVVPLSGRSVPFAAPIAAVGLIAITPNIKPEQISISLPRNISAIPFSVRSRPLLLAHNRLSPASIGVELEARAPVAGESLPLVGRRRLFTPTLRLFLWVGKRIVDLDLARASLAQTRFSRTDGGISDATPDKCR